MYKNDLEVIGCRMFFEKGIVQEENEVDYRPSGDCGVSIWGEQLGRTVPGLVCRFEVVCIIGIEKKVGCVEESETG